MLVSGISHQPTGHGQCGPRPLSSLVNYLAELSWKDVIGLMSPTNPFAVTRRHTCNCLMWQGGRYVIPL
jgi:hypothetical protein